MEIPATRENRVLANAVNGRLKSDARLLNAQAAFYRLAGVALVCAMTGVGVGAALYGWTYARQPVIEAEQVANAVAAALSVLTLKTEGTVKLDPDSRLTMTPPSEVPRPTEAQLGTGSSQRTSASVNTAFTVFKTSPFGQGQVVTGWNFATSDQKSPQHQYCYYSEQIDGTSKVTIDLGENGRPAANVRARPGMDPVLAYATCVWFKGGAI